ncbi:MAG: hypothetical protein ACJ77K_05540 [Bacteroidia bacterium]
MKNLYSFFLLALLPILFFSCAGSETYRGKWKGMDKDGNKLDIEFAPNSFSVKDTAGNSSTFQYTQNSVQIDNSVTTYGIQLKDGRQYQVKFPIANNVTEGLVNDENGRPMFTICRNKYLPYNDLYRLN